MFRPCKGCIIISAYYTIKRGMIGRNDMSGMSLPFPISFYSFCTTVITIILLLLVLAMTFHIAADVAATVLSF